MMKLSRTLIIITLISAAVSCDKLPDKPVAVPKKIEFQPVVRTKSYITSATDTEFRKGFSVFAGKTERPDPAIPTSVAVSKEIMENYKVHYDNGVWTYNIEGISPAQPDVYWGLNCDHHFLAIYPYTNSITEHNFGAIDKTCHIPVVNTNQGAGDNPDGRHVSTDYMYARHHEYFKLGDSPAPIILNMKHALSAISFKVRNASENDIENIIDINLSGLYNRATDLAIARDTDTDPTMVLDPKSIGTYRYDNTAGNPDTPFILMGDPDFHTIIGPEIIIPQDFLKLQVTLKLKVKFVGIETPKELSYIISKVPLQGAVKDQYTYLPGKHYIYRLDILNDYINCSVRVVDWIDNTPIELT